MTGCTVTKVNRVDITNLSLACTVIVYSEAYLDYSITMGSVNAHLVVALERIFDLHTGHADSHRLAPIHTYLVMDLH